MKRLPRLPISGAVSMHFLQMRLRILLLLFVGLIICRSAEAAGTIIVSHDDWPLSDVGFTQSADASTFATNLADWFTGGGPGNFLAHTVPNGVAYTGASLASTMTGAGHSWTVSQSTPWDLTTLSAFDGIFLTGHAAPSISVLVDYVNNGGNVYLSGGTQQSSSLLWNPFLNTFGLSYDTSFNGILATTLPISSPHPIFDGVSSLYSNLGNSIIDLEPSNPNNEILISHATGGLFAIAIPEPSYSLLSTIAVLSMMWFGRGPLARNRSNYRRS